ncbi:ubiquinol cytochrome C oxidoreductase, cytochrome C1 subunit [Roseibacterium elongatum DSM 19469]|uniref:Cytochrome c1 n=1 Tax=Roseicyclus elongatus DSM 19469 TaxID=1294273 RepID=W8RQF9_9RHOB|nr:cytochrome c1 [Roseibacterium elongatum]AHM03303.1 ubiquinol cytochrome C oxidoreductase, cytochrome C1 subunit [Roseibacterium elongatum DSM 19469]
MFRKLAITTATALALGTGAALAAGGGGHVTDYSFSFEGPFGTFDQNQLQRGLQVYTEVCAACHGMTLVPIRSLTDEDGPGLTDDEVRAYIEMNYIEVYDEDLQDWRPATPNDHFPEGSYEGAPDLSVMAKARAGFHGPYGLGLNQLFNGIGGPEYMASYLVNYTGEEQELYGTYLYGNTTFEGGWTQMAPPLWDGMVEYADGAPNDMESLAVDVSAFLMWAAEPHMMDRKQMGFTAVLLLGLLSVLLYLTNKRLWAPVKARAKGKQPAE